MQRFRNILVGVDLSHADRLASADLNPPTQTAVEHATWLAGQLSAELTFFSAIELSAQAQELLELETGSATDTVEREANRVLGELVDGAKQQGVEAKCRSMIGKAWVEIIRQVIQRKHDLVIVGTRDLRMAGRILFGSTAMKLLRKCPCPVWVTKPGFRRDELNVLVPSDLSDVSQHALEIAVNGRQLVDMNIHLLHVYDDYLDRRILLTGLPEDKVTHFRETTRAQVEQFLRRHLENTDYRGLKHGVQVHVEEGQADSVILDAIEKYEIDLLVMGTAARHGIPGLLLGNTAERLLPHVTCSVLAIKPSDFQSPVTID